MLLYTGVGGQGGLSKGPNESGRKEHLRQKTQQVYPLLGPAPGRGESEM